MNKTILNIFWLSAALLFIKITHIQAQSQPDADSVRAARAKMISQASIDYQNKHFTRADTLRGSITAERAWWDVKRYDIMITPDFEHQSTRGQNIITYQVTSQIQPAMQIDLQAPLMIDSVVSDQNKPLEFTREGNVYHIQTPRQSLFSIHQIRIAFHGQPIIAARPPWDGGWTFAKDPTAKPWMTVCCQGVGASIWYPCKDHQSDEPEKGATVAITAPSHLMAVSNGRKISQENHLNGTTTTKWEVKSPISNYCIIPYIGNYDSFSDIYQGENGPLDIHYYVLKHVPDKDRTYLSDQVHHMLQSMEYWFGPYPFYKDGYQIIQVQHTGMEHQSAVAYGNRFTFGYRGKDLSGTGWGLKWDFIIVHESGHEWFGNNITTKDLADMWVHESFANYSETLYVEYRWGKKAGNEYNYGIRRNIKNDRPIIPRYGVNESGSGDMYYKGSNMLHSIRHSMGNDSLFRSILIGLNKKFYHQTVTGNQIQQYICQRAGFDYLPIFLQYLTTTQIPTLAIDFNRSKSEARYRWETCLNNFNLPIAMQSSDAKNKIKLYPTTQWQTIKLTPAQHLLLNSESLQFNYYIKTTIK